MPTLKLHANDKPHAKQMPNYYEHEGQRRPYTGIADVIRGWLSLIDSGEIKSPLPIPTEKPTQSTDSNIQDA
jgi:hypothetical protein